MYSTIKKLRNRWLVLLLISTNIFAENILDVPKKFFEPGRNQHEEQLTHLKNDYSAWQTLNLEQLKKIQGQLELFNRMLADAKNQLKDVQGKDAEFWNKYISLLHEII